MSSATTSPRTRIPLLIAGAGLVLIAGSLALHRYTASPVAHVGPARRIFESRLTSIDYAPFGVFRSGADITAAEDYDVLANLQSRVAQARTAENLRLLANARAAIGRMGPASELLEEASRLEPANATVLGDLAAVEITLGSYADAAEHAGRARDAEPGHEVAAFNWALALEKLANRPGAIDAWQQYLALDDVTPWATEARKHLDDLRAPRPTFETERDLVAAGMERARIERLVRRYPQRSRAWVQTELLPAWVERGRPADLAALRAIGETRAAMGDPYVLDIVNHAALHREAIARGIRAHAAAREHVSAGEWDAAAASFEEAVALLRDAGSPLATGAEISAASTALSAGSSDAALERVTAIQRSLAILGDRYPALAAEAWWIRGLAMARRGATDEALDAYRRALVEARRSGEVEHEMAISELVATRVAAVGEPEEADRLRLQVLRRFDEIGAEPARMYTAYQETAFTSLRLGRPHVALAFADAAGRIAAQTRDPSQLAETGERRALAFRDVGRKERAIVAITSARAHALRIPSTGMRERVLAQIDYTTGRIEMPERPREAMAAYSAALTIWERYGWRNHTASGFLARGRAALAAGDRVAAVRDFYAGIEETERQRAGISEPVMRVAYFERSDVLFDELTRILLDDGEVSGALSMVERKRARFLLDQMADDTAHSAPLDGEEIARAGKGMSILELALFDRDAEIWLIQDGRIVHARSAATRAMIEATVARHLTALSEGNMVELRQSGRSLFDQLIAPVASHLSPRTELAIAADGVLQSFPFATLMTADGEYLIKRHAIAMAPSASVLLRTPRGTAQDTLLAVAQPSPQGFDVLQGAVHEAEEIARLHPRGRVVTGESITPREFLDAAARGGVVHFCGHAKADPRRPSRSSLIFESASGADPLTAEMVRRSRLTGHPFVVLAACSTGRGKFRRTEGVDSLASAFLQAGARGVAATLWDIDDEASSKLFQAFHEHLRAGARPADALRAAQVSFLASSDPRDRDPAVWASVIVIGTI